MIKKKSKINGFALPLSLILLVVMSLMAGILVSKTTTEHKSNTNRDFSQQAFYAAESGLTKGRNWMTTNAATLKTQTPVAIDGNLSFCKIAMFPNLAAGSKGLRLEKNNMSSVLTGLSADERTKFQKVSYEYFITFTSNASGNTDNAKTKTSSESEGTSVTEGTQYKKASSDSATYYTIYSCGCNNAVNSCDRTKDTIVRLEQDVTLVH